MPFQRQNTEQQLQEISRGRWRRRRRRRRSSSSSRRRRTGLWVLQRAGASTMDMSQATNTKQAPRAGAPEFVAFMRLAPMAAGLSCAEVEVVRGEGKAVTKAISTTTAAAAAITVYRKAHPHDTCNKNDRTGIFHVHVGCRAVQVVKLKNFVGVLGLEFRGWTWADLRRLRENAMGFSLEGNSLIQLTTRGVTNMRRK
jgi:hypothetical protein